MNTLVALIKDLFSFGGNDNEKVGLSQFNRPQPKKISEQNVLSRPGEIKLSDLMRKSY